MCSRCKRTDRPMSTKSQCIYCIEKNLASGKAYRIALRLETLAAYGGKCVCCGESNHKFLTLDHIEGSGNSHRIETGGSIRFSGYKFYLAMKRQGFPPTLQILCWNCNAGRHMNGGVCPHLDT